MKTTTLVLLLAALVPVNVMSAQNSQQPPFTLRTSTDIVLVNVSVRDKDGKFLRDLKAGDFTILEDGKPQQVISLDVENTDSVVSSETPAARPLEALRTPATPPPANDTKPVPPSEFKDRRLIVLFFDLSSMQPEEVD